MKLKFILSIFLFLLLLTTSHAETQAFEKSYDIQHEDYYYHTSRNLEFTIDRIYFNDIDYVEGFNYIVCNINTWYGSDETSDYVGTTFYNDLERTNVVGSGYVGFSKFADGRYRVQFFFTSFNDSLTGAQIIYWDNNDLKSMSAGQTDHIPSGSVQGIVYGTTKMRVGGKAGSQITAINGYHYIKNPYYWINTVTYDYNITGGHIDFDLDRSSTYTSRLIVDNGNEELANETTQEGEDRYIFSCDLENCTWNVTIYSSEENPVEHQLDFCSLMGDGGPETEGTITLSQITYVKPDPVIVNIDLENADYVNYRYYAVIQNYNGSAWVDLTNWEQIRSDWESSKVWEYTWTDDNLPITIRGAIYEYDLNADTYDMISYSGDSTYVEPPANTTGSISTDKTVYDVGDTVVVDYTTMDSGYVIAQKWPTAMWDMGEYQIWDVIAGSGTRTFVIPPSGSGEWRVKLSVNNQEVDTVFFTVNETTSPFLAWHDIDGILGETQALRFYSDDAAATLKIYDADLTVIYDETVGDGYFDNYAISTQTNQPPGDWIASLNCSGSYYNDTLIMYAKDAYVSFNADSYMLDQTITVRYYLKRSTETIVLYDANKKDVITWTTTGNYIHLGSGSVDFTLSDDNEYGLNVVSDVDAGNIKLGLWRVEVLDRGQPIPDNPVYDTAKVSSSIDDPMDASNEMISIFFSPEGLFLLFTAALTMMGLVAAHHPAGGAAGAVVGVGFGTYFNVLPIWMLMLMVIALVVLAGVSVAVHFKGK